MPDAKPINIFIAYAHADEAFLRPLRKHLAVLEDDGVDIWYDGEILPGEEWDLSIKTRLKAADIILLLVSIDFLTSDYVKGTELPTALSRHAAGECVVVPVIVRNCLWQKKLGNLQALPKEAKPVADWSSVDNAYHNVVEGLDKVATEIKEQREKEKYSRLSEFCETMVFVEGGPFEMGSDQFDAEKPVHSVFLQSFYIGKYLVTQRQWKTIMGENPAYFQGDENCPVEKVNWVGVQRFIKRLNEKTHQCFRLPSESEWEYAARGGNQSKGFEFAGSNEIDEVGWYYNNAGDKTHPVGQKKSNELGLYDMSGNVWEWCEDIWQNNHEKAPTDGSARTDGSDPNYRVLRGGSLNLDVDYCRSTNRNCWLHNFRNCFIGFRLAHDYPM